jgi:hypothetical protein
MINTYLITPIKRTLENKKHPNKLGCFFFNDWENGLLETVFDNTIQNITNVNKTPEMTSMTFDVSENTSQKAFNTKYHGTKDKKNEISKTNLTLRTFVAQLIQYRF